MAALRVNILTNYAGQLWMAVMGVAFLPLYIRILGMEAFGLVGLMLSIQSISQLFDFGIGGAANRELSRRTHDPALADGARDLVRSAEVVIWLLTVLIGLAVWIGSGPMADHWLHLQTMRRDEARHAIAVMGIAIALLWPNAFYANCLSGLERQPALNVINAIFATLRSAGVLVVLLWISPTLKAFLWWYAAVGVAQSFTTAIAVWSALPAGERHARWTRHELRSSSRFAGGLFAIGLLAMGVSQLDRLSIASLRPLAELGYYTLALSVAAGLGRMVLPMFNALYPRFSRLVARDEQTALRELYHLSSQCLAVVIAAVAAVLIIYAHDVLLLWTGDANLAGKLALPMAILVAGSALNGLMNIPYALQLANGWTRLAMVLNAASLLAGVPFCLWAVPRYGMNGAACLWLLANLASIAAGIPAMHRRLLQGEMARWYLRDTLPPIVAAVSITLAFRLTLSPLSRSAAGFAVLALISITTLVVSALASDAVRGMVRAKLTSVY
jgi:O-antigen/teichoic acid export membrane protein